jgi:hypothetical protein
MLWIKCVAEAKCHDPIVTVDILGKQSARYWGGGYKDQRKELGVKRHG